MKRPIISLLLVVLAYLLNAEREFLFGFKEGYAPHNITFTFFFLLPILSVSFLLAVSAIGKQLKQYFKNGNKKNEERRFYIVLFLSLPGLIIGFIVIAINFSLLFSF